MRLLHALRWRPPFDRLYCLLFSKSDSDRKRQGAHVLHARDTAEVGCVHHRCEPAEVWRVENVIRLKAEVGAHSLLLREDNLPVERRVEVNSRRTRDRVPPRITELARRGQSEGGSIEITRPCP